MRMAILALAWVFPSMAWSADSPEVVLMAIRDAQSANLTRYPEGILEARSTDLNHVMKERNTATFHLEWKGEAAYWKYTYDPLDSVTGEQKRTRVEGTEHLTTGKQVFVYNAKKKYFSSSPVGRFSLADEILDVRPSQTWYNIYPLWTTSNWRDLIDGCLKAKRFGIVTTDDHGVVTWTSKPDALVKSEIVFDLNQGGNVISNWQLPAKLPTGMSLGFDCRLSWAPDGHGHFRLKKYTGTQFTKVVTDPSWVMEVEILKFDPRPVFAANRFSRESIHLVSGTQIETFDAKPGSQPKTSQHGKSSKPQLSKAVLDELSKELKENGTANPQREVPPR